MVAISEVMNMFWGVTLDGGKRYSQTVEHAFHISMAALENAHKLGDAAPVAVMIQHDKAEFLLCSLGKRCPQQPLDLNFTEGEEVTFFLNGKGVVHLTGFLQEDEAPYPELGDGEMDLSEEDMSDDLEDSDGESYEEDEDQSDVSRLLGVLGDADEDDSDEDDEEFDPTKGKRKRKESLSTKKKAKIVHIEDDDDDDSDDDSDEDDDSDDDEEEFEWDDESDMSDFFDDEAVEVNEGEEDDEDDDEENNGHLSLEAGQFLNKKSKKNDKKAALSELQKAREKKNKTPAKDSQNSKVAESPKGKPERTPGKEKSKAEISKSPTKSPKKEKSKAEVTQSPTKTPGKEKHKQMDVSQTNTPANGQSDPDTPSSSKKKKKKKNKNKNKEASETPEKMNEQKSEQSTPTSGNKKKDGKGKTPDGKGKTPDGKKEVKTPAKTPKKLFQGGVTAQEIKEGHGPEAMLGRMVSVHYTGRLQNGKVFDSSTSGGPFKFKLGKQEVIKGWDVGVAGMKVGGKRKLVIPPKMGYGPQRMGDIPPNSTLTFDVELKAVS